MLINAFVLAARAVRRNLLRSFLTVLGVVIGVAAVITMVTLGNGATRMVTDQIASLGSNLLMIRPGQRVGPVQDSAGAPNFHIADAEAIAEQINGLVAVAPASTAAVTLVAGINNWASTITGSSNQYFLTGNWTLSAGRYFSEEEERAGRAVCVIGATVKRELFGKEAAIGNPIRVKNFDCEVVGLLTAKGQGAMGMDQDDTVVMPLQTVQRRLTGNTDISTILVTMKESANPGQVMEQIRTLIRERRKLNVGDADDFNVMDTKQIADTLSGVIRALTGLLGAVAAVSLLVGGIGIMNIMLVSVTERTREIGVRLAIGALEIEVLLQFLVESIVLSALGGFVGVVLAFLASLLLTAVTDMPFIFDLRINVIAFGFAIVIGVLFGYFPARRAARLDPIEALRHE